MTISRSLLLAACAAAAGAVELPAVDLLGGAAFTNVTVGLGIGFTDAHARDADKDFNALRLSGSAYSVSGYPAAANPKVGGLLGGAVLARLYAAHDNDIRWTALDPTAVLVGGGYYKPSDGLRFELTGEAGPGLDFARFDDGDASRSAWFRPSLHAGVHLAAIGELNPRSELGVIFGYDYDRLPYVTSAGPFIALVLTWKAGPGAKPAD